jgi:hypothetical protein
MAERAYWCARPEVEERTLKWFLRAAQVHVETRGSDLSAHLSACGPLRDDITRKITEIASYREDGTVEAERQANDKRTTSVWRNYHFTHRHSHLLADIICDKDMLMSSLAGRQYWRVLTHDMLGACIARQQEHFAVFM